MDNSDAKRARAIRHAKKHGRFGRIMPVGVEGPWRRHVVVDQLAHIGWGFTLMWQSVRRAAAIWALGLAQRLLPWWDLANAKKIEALKATIRLEDHVWDRLYHHQTQQMNKRLESE